MPLHRRADLIFKRSHILFRVSRSRQRFMAADEPQGRGVHADRHSRITFLHLLRVGTDTSSRAAQARKGCLRRLRAVAKSAPSLRNAAAAAVARRRRPPRSCMVDRFVEPALQGSFRISWIPGFRSVSHTCRRESGVPRAVQTLPTFHRYADSPADWSARRRAPVQRAQRQACSPEPRSRTVVPSQIAHHDCKVSLHSRSIDQGRTDDDHFHAGLQGDLAQALLETRHSEVR